MNMIFDTAHLYSGHLVLSRNAADIFPDALFDFGLDVVGAILSAENDVVIQRCVGVRHNCILVFLPTFNGQVQSSLRDWEFISSCFPGLEKAGLRSIVAPRLGIYFVSLSRP